MKLRKLAIRQINGELDDLKRDFSGILYSLAILSILFNTIYDVAFGIKALLIYVMSIVVARETEIIFLAMKDNIHRPEAKEAIKITKPEITGIIFALLLPVGTPLFVVGVGSFISIFVGKMIFGGYTFNVFNPAIVGRLFVAIAWPALVTIPFPNILDNYLIGMIFNRDLSVEVLTPLMQLEANGIVSLNNMKGILELLFKPQPGMLFSMPGIIYLILIIYMAIKKFYDLKPLIFTTIFSLIVLITVTLGFNLSFSYVLFNLLAGGFFFVTLFMMTDPFTKPFYKFGIVIYSGIFSFAFLLIRFLGTDSDGVLYALLFSNIFVPLLNKKTKKMEFGLNIKSVIATLVIAVVLTGTGLFINTILNHRIEDKIIMVGSYGKS